MGYQLEAVLGGAAVLRAGFADQPAAVLVPLRHDLVLVPMTDELFDALATGDGDPPPGFWKLPPGFDRVLASWSVAGPVGYVEADFVGGTGDQCALLWAGDGPALGPLSVAIGEPFPAAGSPISRVLAGLGVERAGDRDEFEVAGLRGHRHTAEWGPVAGLSRGAYRGTIRAGPFRRPGERRRG